MNKIACVFTIFYITFAFAKDYGIQGKTFEIKEENILDAIKDSIAKIDIRAFQNKVKQEAIKSINKPKGISLPQAKEFRSFIFDPSITLQQDLKDHQGKIFAFKGQKINPLKFTTLREKLIFIDGDDDLQVEYSLSIKEAKQIILVKGEPINLNKHHKEMFFFDFNGGLVNRFGIKRLPSVVFQKGEVLEINEIAL